jgi:hypothetical protein
MIQNLNQLVDHIRKTMPFPKALMNLQMKEQIGGVVFYWQGVEFLVKISLQAFEVRGNNLYITGLSTLLQLVLVRGGQEEQRIQSMLDALSNAEELVRVNNQPVRAAERVRAVRESLAHMCGPR